MTVEKLIAKHGSARQALLHLGDGALDRMSDDDIDALFVAAGLDHLFKQLDEPAPKRSRAKGKRTKSPEPGRTI